LLAIIQQRDEHALMDALVKSGLRATKLSSTGGFLGARNTTFLIGLPASEVDKAVKVITETCGRREELDVNSPFLEGHLRADQPMEAKITVGGATIFVLNAEQISTAALG
jgi:uncharacterized protein YaaQ